MVLTLEQASKSPGGFGNIESAGSHFTVGLGRFRICFSNKVLGDAEVTDLGNAVLFCFVFRYTASHVYLCGDRIILEHPACSVDQVLEWMVALPYGFIYIVALSSR